MSQFPSMHDKRMQTTLSHMEMRSPVGMLKLVASADALVAVLWKHGRTDRVKLGASKWDLRLPILLEAERQLSEYFAGKRTQFELAVKSPGASSN